VEPLTPRQKRVLRALLAFFKTEDRAPTTRELARKLRRHVKTIYQYVLVLERKGYIERRKGRIRLAPALREHLGIPLIGRVAAGSPITSIENREGLVSLDELFGRDNVFAVRVKGDSMKDAGILDGDIAVVRSSTTAPAGAFALCYLGQDQETTVKRFRARKDCFELIPENPAYRPVRIPRNDPWFRVGGELIGLMRSLR